MLALRVLRVAVSPFGSLAIATFCCKDLTGPLEALTPRVDVDIRRLEDGDVDALTPVVVEANRTARRSFAVLDAEQAQKLVRTRLARGGVCFVATHQGEIVHYNWLFPGIEWQMPGYFDFVPAAPSEALLDDAFTVEKSRGKGLHGAVHARMLQFARTAGCTTSYTAVATDNRSSRKALKQLGYSFYSTAIIFEARRSGKRRMLRLGPAVTRFRLRP